MGRRAADPNTPVSVLCFPALAGVRGWKTIGDKSLLQTWGLQCSVGVQTSPGISKPLTHVPEILSDNTGQTFNDKKAILKQKVIKTKIKKEVTFRAPGGNASQDVACCHGNSGTYCYARAIRSNPIIGKTITRDKPNVKSAVRYINGSVVDSEAVGGIIEENNETESVQRGSLHGNDLQDHYADHSGKSVVFSAGHPFALPSKIHNDFEGSQPEMVRVAINVVSGPTPDAYPQEKPLKSTLTLFSGTAINQDPHIEKKLKTNSQFSLKTSNMTQATLNQELKLNITPHPECPVHSKGNLANLTHASGVPTSIQPANVLHQRAITVTKATIENRQDDSSIRRSAKPPENHVMSLQTRITSTPQGTSESKPNDPHTSIKDLKTTNCNSSQNPQNSIIYAKVTEHNGTWLKATNEPKSQQVALKSTNTMGQISHFHPLELKNSQLHSTSQPDKLHPISSSEVCFADTAKRSCDLLSLAKPTETTAKHLDQSVSANHKSLNGSSLTRAASVNYESTLHTSSCFPSPSQTALPGSIGVSSTNSHNDLSYRNTAVGTPTYSASQESQLSKEPNISCLTGVAEVFSHSDINKAYRTQDASIKSQDSSETGVIPDQRSKSKTPPPRLSEPQDKSEDPKGSDASSHSKKTLITRNEKLYYNKNKLYGSQINNLAMHNPEHQHSNHPQVTNPQTFISLIKPSTTCLQGCLNTEQQRPACYQGCTQTSPKGQCATSLAVTTSQQTESNRQQLAMGVSAWHASKETLSIADRQTLPNYTLPAVKAHIHCKPVVSLTNTNMQTSGTGNEHFSDYNGSDLDAPVKIQAHKSVDCFVTGTHIGDHSTVGSIVGLETSSEVQSTVKANPAFSPTPPASTVAHAHPADADQLLPPSPQKCKSAILQQKLEAVEASLEANKDRISILLNIIHDLEMCRTPSSCWRCRDSGQDLKHCSSCQKTACIMYSVEYDFRQQERRFLEILSNAAAGNKASSVHSSQHPNFELLRKVLIKNLSKTKLKSKKLCKMLLKWLPRKIQQDGCDSNTCTLQI